MDKQDSNLKYKDKVRHGGKRKLLLETNGQQCSMCGETKDSVDICVHHLLDKFDHRFQVLLCRSCHAKIHVSEKKPIPEDGLREIVESSSDLTSAAETLGLTRGALREKLKKYGLYKRYCRQCKSEFIPTKKRSFYCSQGCATQAEANRIREANAAYDKDKKKESDRQYYLKHRDRLIKKQQEYYESHKDEVLKYHKELYNKGKSKPDEG